MRPLSSRTLIALLAVAALPFAPACKKKESGKAPTEAYKDIEKTFDTSEPAPEERKPVEGIDTAGLEKHMQVRFESMVDKLPSPCGKPHSLRTSRNNDPDCKRAPFAAEYVFSLTEDGATDDEIKELYKFRFGESKVLSFSYDPSTPHKGPTDATVKVVEFYDYGCPACKMMKPVLEEALQGFETDVVIYYKQFPLSSKGHEDSPLAAAAALAADKQGKFTEMHDVLFEHQQEHKIEDINGFAEKLGLDMSKFKADFLAVKPAVLKDKAEGEASGISGTPAIYINGRSYEGPSHPKYFKMWLKEALAEAI